MQAEKRLGPIQVRLPCRKSSVVWHLLRNSAGEARSKELQQDGNLTKKSKEIEPRCTQYHQSVKQKESLVCGVSVPTPCRPVLPARSPHMRTEIIHTLTNTPSKIAQSFVSRPLARRLPPQGQVSTELRTVRTESETPNTQPSYNSVHILRCHPVIKQRTNGAVSVSSLRFDKRRANC